MGKVNGVQNGKSKDKFLCLLATFDEDASKKMNEIGDILREAGFAGRQTPDVPPHITMAYYDTSREDEIKQLLAEVCSNTNSFELSFNHVGLFGLEVMFFAPDVNHELLELRGKLVRDSMDSNKEWTAHSTILIDEAESVLKALPIVTKNFQHLSARVKRVGLYEFFPTRFIAEYDLK